MRAAAAMGVALLVAGCAALAPVEIEEPAPAPAPTPLPAARPGPPPVSGTENLLNYFQHLRRLALPELGREHEAVRRAYAQERTDFNRIRLAMVLSLPGTPLTDEARALDLIEPVMRDPRSGFSAVAVLMGTYLQENRRLGTSVQSMQKKLEELKSLERSLIERERGGAAKR